MGQTANTGVLIPLSWDETKWEGMTDANLSNYRFAYIRDYLNACERLTFGHKKFPLESDGYYIGYCKVIFQLMFLDETFCNACSGKFIKSKGVFRSNTDFKIIYFGSFNSELKETYIVGFYAFPDIDWSTGRKANHKIFKSFSLGNIRAKSEDIVRFDNYLPLNGRNFSSMLKELKGKDRAYLTSENILTILDEAIKINPKQLDLKTAVGKLKKELKKTVAATIPIRKGNSLS
jgi:5-methylcytosine-specific restriction protein A